MQKKRPRQQPIEYSQQPADDVKPIIDDAPADSTSMPMILTNSMPKPLTPSDSMTLQFATKPAQTATADREPVETSLRNEDLAEEKAIPANTVDETGEPLKLHVVQPKQTYHSISQLYGVTTKQLYAWNNLSERIPLQVGQELILDLTKKQLPVRSIVKVVTRPKAPPRPAKMINAFLVEPAGRIAYHIVQAGQTVYRVALINKVSVPDLIRWNKLKDNTIEIGQKLLIMKGK